VQKALELAGEVRVLGAELLAAYEKGDAEYLASLRATHERQILAAERRRDMAFRELNNHQRQIEHAIEVQNFLRDKFTNHALYLFLQQETAALHYQTYELALHAARQAQRAFNYERGYTARTFLPDDAWDNLHEGLMAGQRLHFAVRQMEQGYLGANCREYELTKHISLRLNSPLAFLWGIANGGSFRQGFRKRPSALRVKG